MLGGAGMRARDSEDEGVVGSTCEEGCTSDGCVVNGSVLVKRSESEASATEVLIAPAVDAPSSPSEGNQEYGVPAIPGKQSS